MHRQRALAAGMVAFASSAALLLSTHPGRADGPAPAAPSAPPVAAAVASPVPPAPPEAVFWQEHFDHRPLSWLDPFDHKADTLFRVYSLQREGSTVFLHAHHDASVDDRPPAMHYGHAFVTGAPPLEKVKALTWRWRVNKHPAVTDDGWQDMAGGVYVVTKQPSLLVGGKGFKFGWLAKPGATGEHQHGLLEVELRHDPAGSGWKTETVDLCALYRKEFGACEGQHVLYVGVVTDADGTKSVADADYADFEIVAQP